VEKRPATKFHQRYASTSFVESINNNRNYHTIGRNEPWDEQEGDGGSHQKHMRIMSMKEDTTRGTSSKRSNQPTTSHTSTAKRGKKKQHGCAQNEVIKSRKCRLCYI
jgi:hypothetical protein